MAAGMAKRRGQGSPAPTPSKTPNLDNIGDLFDEAEDP